MITSVTLPPREGIGLYVANLARHLATLGHEVLIITRGGLRRQTGTCQGKIEIRHLPFAPVYPFHVHLHSLFVDRYLAHLGGRIDLIHLHTPLVRFPNAEVPSIVTVHTPMQADVGAVKADSLLGILARLQLPVSRRLERGIFERVDRVVAVATSVARELEAYGLEAGTVAVLGNGADTTLFSPNGPAAAQSEPYFLTAGRLAPRKGLADLVRAAGVVRDHLPHARFYIAGSGPYQERLARLIRREGLVETVHLLGHVESRAAMVALYRNAVAYLHPAHYEGLPTVVLEAMACGRPVVATAVGGALDVIRDGENGLLVPAQDPEQLAQAALRVVQEPALASRLGAAARVTVERRYAWPIITRRYLHAYRELLR